MTATTARLSSGYDIADASPTAGTSRGSRPRERLDRFENHSHPKGSCNAFRLEVLDSQDGPEHERAFGHKPRNHEWISSAARRRIPNRPSGRQNAGVNFVGCRCNHSMRRLHSQSYREGHRAWHEPRRNCGSSRSSRCDECRGGTRLLGTGDGRFHRAICQRLTMFSRLKARPGLGQLLERNLRANGDPQCCIGSRLISPLPLLTRSHGRPDNEQ